MNIQTLFKDNIHRQIDGVIKADDHSNLIQEVSEYVITAEISGKLDKFFEAYNDIRHSNAGVWISGFFGCGKSHLLKMLSLLLEDVQVDNTRLFDLFLPKIEDEMLKAQFKKAVSIPSKSILFNIDQNASQTSTGEDEILGVFNKVFNGMQGFYENSPYIAEFESHLKDDGLLEKFKQTYQDLYGESWESGRETAHLLDNEEFAKALVKVKPMSEAEALKTLDRYESSFDLSIKSFCQKVKKYLDQQPKGFRLNFYVDEVGQYIAGKGNLMLNLQTLAESLTTVCEGRAWILVTAQQDMESIVGDMNSQQSNDFSKIQGRFPTRISLTSANVAEVIQRRLLTKKTESQAELSTLYAKECNNIKAIFQFGDDSRTYKTYKDQEHFILCYPFLPYQFELFQESLRQLSRHNAFEGKNRAIGERSMLSVFQDVLKNISELSLGQVAPFDLMFEGLKQAIKGEALKSIHQAEKSLSDPFHIRTLKALFLIKFDHSFKATKRNISILLIEAFDANLKEHDKRVQEALNKLEQESFIQRLGNVYEFLTDTEKDIENEIKDTDIERTAIGDLLKEILYQEILKDSKVRYEGNGNDYAFTRKIDDQMFGRESELGINILTQLTEGHGDPAVLVNMFRSPDEMLVILPEDKTLVDDLRLFKKTEKYIQLKNSAHMREEERRILMTKADQNNNRRSGLLAKLEEMLTHAAFYVNGTEIKSSGSEPRSKVHRAFQELIQQTYPHLKMLSGKTYKEEFLKEILLDTGDQHYRPDIQILHEAQKDLFNTINREKNKGSRSTVKSLLEIYEKKPYGWYQSAMLCLIAELFELNKIEVRQDSNTLNARELYNNLTNSRTFTATIIEPQQEFSEKQISDLKSFHREYFDANNTGKDAKAVADVFAKALVEESHNLEKLTVQKDRYPFLAALEPAIAKLKSLSNKDYSTFLLETRSFEDELLNQKEDHTDKIKKFMNGEMKKIYDEARSWVDQSRANFDYLKGVEVDTLKNLEGFKEPYKGNVMQNIKQALDKVKTQVEAEVSQHRQLVSQDITDLVAKLQSDSQFSHLKPQDQELLTRPLLELQKDLAQQQLIPVIKDYGRRAKELQLKQLNKAAELGTPTPPPPSDTRGTKTVYVPPVKKITVGVSEVKPIYGKACLESEADVDEYLGGLRAEYLRLIKENKRIQI
jgi:hypothetical protein